ncbi:MAG: adenylate/guanylate cyclase domain-containing protein [Desulfamplus sp.]|nr:adenylate/guanylate cyclase domain-containing protein [Desulfamplus sp.]
MRNLKIPVVVSGLVVTILAVMLYLAEPYSVRIIDRRLYDICCQLSLLNSKSSNQEEGVIKGKDGSYSAVIVDIDEYSLDKFGQWSWPRYRVAELINKIHDAGSAAIGIDIVFAEPDRTSPIEIQKAIKENFNIDLTFSDLSQSLIESYKLMDNDALLAQAIIKSSATLGYYFNFASQPATNNKNSQIASSYIPQLIANIEFKIGSDPDAIFNYIFKASDILAPIPELLSSDKKYAGFMNTLSDEDGILRRTPLFISWNGKLYTQLALATLLQSLSKKGAYEPIIKLYENGIESIRIGNTTIPLERNGSMLLNYRGASHTFPYISAAKILENSVDISRLKDKIVFIGSSASGLKDIRMSPFDHDFPGVEVHATIVDNIIKGDFILRPDWASALELILTILCGIYTTLLIGWSGAWTTLIISLAVSSTMLISSLSILSSGLFEISHHIWISPLFPLLTLSINFAILNLVKYGLSEKDKRFYKSAFGHYVSKAVVNQIIESPETFNLDGEEKEITLLFSDIRDFSSISETLSPSQVSSLLHKYFTPITKIVINHHGTLDKFIGDAMMCFWNAPINVENHKSLALNTAIKIIDKLDALSREFEKDYGVKIKTGFGIHSGVCRVGNMGSADLFDYTAIGDNVNIASRLEGLTKFYGVNILFSQVMIPDNQKDMLIQYVDRVRVKGKFAPINIYTLHLVKTGVEYAFIKNEIDQYNYAIELYKKRDFKFALEALSLLNGKQSGMSQLYSIYKRRAVEFNSTPPDDKWDGVFNHTSK